MGTEQKTGFIDEICRVIELLSPSMDDFLYIYDFEKDFYYISKEAANRFRISSHMFHDTEKSFQEFVYPADYPRLMEDLQLLRTKGKNTHNLIYRWMSKNDEPIWINCRGQVMREEGVARYLVGCINEIGVKQKADNLSGLLGDSSFQAFIGEYTGKRPNGFFLRIGVDELKGINARLGVEYGNQILRVTASKIEETISEEQRLYKIIGDEFLVVDFSGGTLEDVHQIYHTLREKMEDYISENDYDAVFTLSGGVVLCQDIQHFTYSDIMRLTEYALGEAKHRGRNRCYDFSRDDYQRFLEKRNLMGKLRRAIKHDMEGFQVYYQPIFRADNGEIYGAEALMRFFTKDQKMVSPAEFIPILEESGLIIPVGRWLVHQAFSMCGEFQKLVPDFHININLSNVQIMKSDVGGDILDAIQIYNLNPQTITVELTESGFLESDYCFSDMWQEMKQAGVLLALDDFGTGYSNFRYITELQPDIIKIDRTFTMKVMENAFEYELLSLFTKMAHNLNLKICVEGIETEEEREKIYQLAPDCFQGFYFGRPCAKEQFFEQFGKQD